MTRKYNLSFGKCSDPHVQFNMSNRVLMPNFTEMVYVSLMYSINRSLLYCIKEHKSNYLGILLKLDNKMKIEC